MPVVLNRQVCGRLMCANRELVSILHFTLLRSHCRSGVWTPAAQVQSTPPRVTNDPKNVFFHVLAMINSAAMNIGVPGWMHVLGPGALGRPRGIWWRGRWEGGSGWVTHVNPWLIHVSI